MYVDSATGLVVKISLVAALLLTSGHDMVVFTYATAAVMRHVLLMEWTAELAVFR